ncbi:MAG: amidohydrolase family protein [Spirochaetales bacterium]
MRIIDGDCHISPTLEGGNSISVEELIARMDKAGVEKALTWLQPPYIRSRIEESNKYVYESVNRYPHRILGFGWADPNLGIDHAKNMVRKSILDYGFYGVKLNGAQNNFPIDDPKVSLPIIEEIARLGSRLAFHIGADSYNNTHPYRLSKVAKLFPELTIFAVHMGGASFDDMSDLVIDVALQHKNVLLIGSAIRAIPILKAVKTLGPERILFGSDTPFELMQVEVEKYKALFKDEIPELELEMIMGGNLLREFHLL